MKPARFLFAPMLVAMLIAAVAQDAPKQNSEPVVEQKPPAEATAPAAPSGPPVSTLTVPPPPDEDAFKVSSDVELVLLDVSVKDSEGGFVSNLKQSDFKVYEDKVEQTIRTFAAQDVPVTVGLIVDNSGSVRPKKPEIITAALTFVKNSNPHDEVFVVNFNDRVSMGLPEATTFTSDRNLLRNALLSNPAQGRTALYDALDLGLRHLEKGRLAKKTLVLISDGGDNMSEMTHDELMKEAETSLATIYTVGIFDANDKDKNPGFLKSLARLTGGEAYIPQNVNHLVGICDKIAHDIRNRYTIGFTPANRTMDGKIRRLKVIATSPEGKKYEVRTRTHYLASRNLSSRSREGGNK
jgi:Ca-activated chloride channel family protein